MYYKVFVPTVKSVRKFVEYAEDFYETNYIPRNTEMYESIYLYTGEHIKYYNTHTNDKGNNTLAGIKDVVTDKVVFDFDHEQNPDLALADARTLVGRLLEVFGENKNVIRCFFSGNKGYHIEIQFDKEYINREEFEKIIYSFAGDLETFDDSVRDHQRVFRFPLSRNSKTKLYKIPILLDHFTNSQYNHSTFLAEAQVVDEDVPALIGSFRKIAIPEAFKNIRVTEKNKPVVSVENTEFPNMHSRPKHLTPAKYVLSMGFFEEGESHDACMRIAAPLRYCNFTKDQAWEMIKIAVNRRNARLGLEKLDDAEKKKLYYEVIDSVYGNTWNGAVYSDSSDPLLQKTIQRYNLERYYNTISSDVLEISDVKDIFFKFVEELDNNTIKTGIAELDENVLLTSSMMVGILGAPSSGKTGFALSTLVNQSKNNIPSFFMSSDMAAPLFYASAMRRHCKMPFKQLTDLCKDIFKKGGPKVTHWPEEIKKAFEAVNEDFKHVGLCFQSGPSIEDIKNHIDDYEQRKGIGVKFFVMDYLEKMQSKYSDPTASTGFNASRLADLTRDKSLNTFLLLQTQKAAGDPSSPLTSMRNIKGASVIEQDCRVILTTWREGFNPDVKGRNLDDRYQTFACVKNNMGNTGRFDFHIDPDSGLFRSLTDEELVDFDRVKSDNVNRKIAKANGGSLPQRQNGNGSMPTKFVPKPYSQGSKLFVPKTPVATPNSDAPAKEATKEMF